MQRRLLEWLFVGLVLTLASASLASFVPGNVRKVGLFALAYAVLLAFLLAKLAQRGGLSHIKPIQTAGAVALLLLAGLCVLTWLSYWQYRSAAQRSLAEQLRGSIPGQRVLRLLEEDRSPDDPELQEQFRTFRALYRPSFARYLRLRLELMEKRLPRWCRQVAWWPIAFWTAEILVATAAGTFVAYWTIGATATAPTPTASEEDHPHTE